MLSDQVQPAAQLSKEQANDLLKRKILLAELFLFMALWGCNFFMFKEIRAVTIIPIECLLYTYTSSTPASLRIFIYFGVWIPLLVTFVFSFITGFNSLRSSRRDCIIFFILFSLYLEILEYFSPSKILIFSNVSATNG